MREILTTQQKTACKIKQFELKISLIYKLLKNMAKAVSKGGAKTASKNNPSSRKAARKMFHNGIQVKSVKVVGFETITQDGQNIRLKSFIAMANAQNDELIIDGNGVPYDFKYAKPE
jgi:hypothetical protein